MAHWGERLSNARSAEHAALHAPLGPQDGVPLLPLPRPLFTSASSCARALVSQCLSPGCIWILPRLVHAHSGSAALDLLQ